MVSEQFDRCHGMLLQYVEFLGSAVSPASNYAILIPSLSDLVHLYHLDPEVYFFHPVSIFVINFRHVLMINTVWFYDFYVLIFPLVVEFMDNVLCLILH